MAWIESHQELGHHPKLKKLCRVLSIGQPQAVGHLQYLWWWSLDYCEDGDLSRFDTMDIAIGAMWDGDPDEFVNALLICGWLDSDGDRTSIHDWNDYLGRLLERRKKDAERKRTARSFQGVSNGRPEDGAQTAHVTVPYSTVPNPTEQNLSPDGDIAQIAPKPKRKAQIPVDWVPDDAGRGFARSKGMDSDAVIDIEVARFRDHHRSKGTTFLDFPAAWRTWCGNYIGFRPRAPGKANTPQRATDDDIDQWVNELKQRKGIA